VNPHCNITWYHGDDLLTNNDDRYSFQEDNEGWHRVIIEDITTADQGTYYAVVEDCSTSISLVVEGKVLSKKSYAHLCFQR
jgi:hypothetical protein